MTTDDDLRSTLHAFAESWTDDGNIKDRIVRRQRQKRRRTSALACMGVVVAVAVLTPTFLSGGDEGGRESVTADGGSRGGRWRQISTAPIEGRAGASAVWTGTEMLVFGGQHADGKTALKDGARYNPSLDEWRPMAAGPAGGRYSVAVWTGAELLLWGNILSHPSDTYAPGAAYDPRVDRWRTLPEAPIPSRPRSSGVWTGAELIVWGTDGPSTPESLGAAYNPSTDTWRPIAKAPVEARSNHGSVWTGREMIVWGGAADTDSAPLLADGAAYDPSTDTWRTLRSTTLRGRLEPTLLWTGREVVVWGGFDRSGPRLDWSTYEPDSDVWRTHGEVAGADAASYANSGAIWVDDRVVVLATAGSSPGYTFSLDLDGGDLAASPIKTRAVAAVVWTGNELVVWGGQNSLGPISDGAAWQPSSSQGPEALPTTTSTVPDGRFFAELLSVDRESATVVVDRAMFWTGAEADRAAREAGRIGPTEETPGGFYLENASVEREVLPVADDVDVRVIYASLCCEPRHASLASLASAYEDLTSPQGREIYSRHFWLTVNDGRVVDMTAQYVP